MTSIWGFSAANTGTTMNATAKNTASRIVLASLFLAPPLQSVEKSRSVPINY